MKKLVKPVSIFRTGFNDEPDVIVTYIGHEEKEVYCQRASSYSGKYDKDARHLKKLNVVLAHRLELGDISLKNEIFLKKEISSAEMQDIEE